MKRFVPLFLAFLFLLCSCALTPTAPETPNPPSADFTEDADGILPYSGEPYCIFRDGVPDFGEDLLTTASFETYAPLDSLGRCGTAFACIGRDLMPTEERGSIGSVKPSGWKTAKYDFVDGKYLYNRCHLIGWQLSGENANERNLITGTRYFNVEGMLPFENMIADYVKETDHHVLYRVTPMFDGDELVARGAILEAYSVEDKGEGISFAVYCYNVQPGVVIDYATGESAEGDMPLTPDADTSVTDTTKHTYVLNTASKKFHLPDCSSVSKMSEKNKQTVTAARASLIEDGYTPCGDCKP